MARLIDATDSPKYRAIFMLAYGAGLRVSEITALRVCDIDSERMMIHVPGDDRYEWAGIDRGGRDRGL